MQGPQRDYYKDLDINPSATADEVKTAYRDLALKYHPDRAPAGLAEEKVKKRAAKFNYYTEAYDILSNDAQRFRYDRAHHPRLRRHGGAAQDAGAPGHRGGDVPYYDPNPARHPAASDHHFGHASKIDYAKAAKQAAGHEGWYAGHKDFTKDQEYFRNLRAGQSSGRLRDIMWAKRQKMSVDERKLVRDVKVRSPWGGLVSLLGSAFMVVTWGYLGAKWLSTPSYGTYPSARNRDRDR